jgi:hypothetical protein
MRRIYLVGSLAVLAVAVIVFAWIRLADDDDTASGGAYCPIASVSLADCLRTATTEWYIVVTTTPEPN